MQKIDTPVFVLEEEKLIQNLEKIQNVKQQADVDIILAFKGFAMWPAFPIIKKYIAGVAAGSLNEVKLGFGEFGGKVHTYCVAYKEAEFSEMVDRSSHLTFNSLNQYHRFISSVPEEVSVGLRINPEWSDVTTNMYNPSSSTSRLGVTASALDQLPERVEGLHCHVLCESDVYSTIKLLYALEAGFSHFLHRLKWVNLGGGHLLTGEGYDIPLLIDSLKAFKRKHGVHIILEPGSAFVWQSGYLQTTVLDLVNNGGVKTAIIDASFTCHMPDCLEMPYRPEIIEGFSSKREGTFAYKIGGLSCLAGDFLDEYWFPKPVEIGDKLTFLDMMHYTMVKTSTFNGIHHPAIAIQRNHKIVYLREFTFEDFKGRLG